MFIALFTIIDPIGTIPIFLALTRGQTPQEQKRIALAASTAMMITLLVALFAGDDILKLFGINLHAFSLAGMIVIASMAWSMLNAKMSQDTAYSGGGSGGRAEGIRGYSSTGLSHPRWSWGHKPGDRLRGTGF
jgi:multiple antibiotic resistance protein